MDSVFAGLNFPQKIIMILELAFLLGAFILVVFKFLSGKKVSLNLKDILFAPYKKLLFPAAAI